MQLIVSRRTVQIPLNTQIIFVRKNARTTIEVPNYLQGILSKKTKDVPRLSQDTFALLEVYTIR